MNIGEIPADAHSCEDTIDCRVPATLNIEIDGSQKIPVAAPDHNCMADILLWQRNVAYPKYFIIRPRLYFNLWVIADGQIQEMPDEPLLDVSLGRNPRSQHASPLSPVSF